MNLRDQIVQTATELFMKQGYVATSTRQIATILNVSQPAIYHYFKNKEEIFLIVISEVGLKVGEHLRSVKESSSRDQLLSMALYLKRNHEMNFTLMMHDLENAISLEANKKIFKLWYENYFMPFIDFFHSIEAAMIPGLDVTKVSQHFLKILSTYISETYRNDALEEVELGEMVDIFLRGISGNNYESLC